MLFLHIQKTTVIDLVIECKYKCDALPQNREQVIFRWSEFLVFYKEHTVSFNLTTKSSSYSYIFEIRPFVYKTLSGFSGSVILRNLPLKLPIPIVLDLMGYRKSYFFFLMFESQSKIK